MRLLWTFLVPAGLAAGLAASPATGQAPTGRPPGPAGPTTPTLSGELRLGVADAVAMGIENNLDVEIVRHDPFIANEQRIAAWGAFDPEAFGGYSYASDETPIASSLQPSQTVLAERTLSGDAGIRGLIPLLGWSYEVGYSAQSIETTSAISDLSPEYRPTLNATATMPILRGFLWGESWTQVKLTGISSDSALEDFRRVLMDTIDGIERSYWELAARRDRRRVARKSLETALELLEQTEAQYEVGVVSKVEVTEAESGVARREFDLIVAQNVFEEGQDRLIDEVLGPFLRAESTLQIVTTDPPEDYTDYDVDPEVAAANAMALRPELALARNAVEEREVRLKFAKNQRLPRIDLRASWGAQGLAGRTNPAPSFTGGPRPPVTNVGRTFGEAHDTWFDGNQADSWSAGAVVSVPIGNTRGRADVRSARLELRKAMTRVRRQEQDIILQVRNAVRNLRSALEGIESAESAERAASEQLRAERIRLEHGESTPFDVLQREEDLVDAESSLISALREYHVSETALDRAQGTILRDRNIVVDEALPLR